MKKLLLAFILSNVLGFAWAATSSVHEESEFIVSFCEDPFYGITNEVDASIRTRQSEKGIEYFVDFEMKRSSEYTVHSTTVESKQLNSLLAAFNSLLAAYPKDKEKEKAGKKIANEYEINHEASIGYYFGYDFDDGWRFIVDDGSVWIDDEKLEEFHSFLTKIHNALARKMSG